MPTRHHEGQPEGRAWRAEDGDPAQWQERGALDAAAAGQQADTARLDAMTGSAPGPGSPTPHEESLGIYAHDRSEPDGPVWGGPPDDGSGRLPGRE